MKPMLNFSTDLRGKVALVTGASSGLGLRFAQVLASAGACVGLAARRLDALNLAVAEIKASGGEAIPIALDVAESEQLQSAVDQLEHTFGRVDILVNNAGVTDAQRAHKMSIHLIDHVIGVNLRAPYILSCEVARRLLSARQAGRIINIASMAAFHYTGNAAALYSTTKAGVVRMTEALAVEWAGFGINVNAIAPGAFASEMMDGMLERIGDISQGFPRQRIAEPNQLDSTLLYLASPASDAVTGTCIRVDDGQYPR